MQRTRPVHGFSYSDSQLTSLSDEACRFEHRSERRSDGSMGLVASFVRARLERDLRWLRGREERMRVEQIRSISGERGCANRGFLSSTDLQLNPRTMDSLS